MHPIKIGLFDSGVGGLTVLAEIATRLPKNAFVYFGDTARCPYGPKSDKTIVRYSIENSIFLLEQGIDLLVLACNTATSVALEQMQKMFNIPVIGVIDSAVEKAALVTTTGRIGVIGTKATIQSGVYQQKLNAHLKTKKKTIFTSACPLFVPLIEENFTHDQIIRLIVQQYLTPLKKKNIDTLVLGCTHYPLLHDVIQEEMGPSVTIVDSAKTCADTVAELSKTMRSKTASKPGMQLYVSDDPTQFRAIGERFFGKKLPEIKLVTTESTR